MKQLSISLIAALLAFSSAQEADAQIKEPTKAPSTKAPSTKAPESSKKPQEKEKKSEEAKPAAEEKAGSQEPTKADEPPEAQPDVPPKPYGEEKVTETEIELTPQEEKKAAPRKASPPKEKIDPSSLPFTYHQSHFDFSIGFQIQGAQDNALEPFINDEVLAELFFRAGGAFYHTGALAFALTGEFGTLTRQSSVRRQETRLGLNRFNLGLEGRYHFHHRFFASLRAAPGAEHASMRLGNEYDLLRFENSSWAFATDVSAGVALRFLGSSDGRQRSPRAWLFLEGGGHFAAKHDATLEAVEIDEEDQEDGLPERPEPIVLDSFTTSGPFVSLSLMGTF